MAYAGLREREDEQREQAQQISGGSGLADFLNDLRQQQGDWGDASLQERKEIARQRRDEALGRLNDYFAIQEQGNEADYVEMAPFPQEQEIGLEPEPEQPEPTVNAVPEPEQAEPTQGFVPQEEIPQEPQEEVVTTFNTGAFKSDNYDGNNLVSTPEAPAEEGIGSNLADWQKQFEDYNGEADVTPSNTQQMDEQNFIRNPFVNQNGAEIPMGLLERVMTEDPQGYSNALQSLGEFYSPQEVAQMDNALKTAYPDAYANAQNMEQNTNTLNAYGEWRNAPVDLEQMQNERDLWNQSLDSRLMENDKWLAENEAMVTAETEADREKAQQRKTDAQTAYTTAYDNEYENRINAGEDEFDAMVYAEQAGNQARAQAETAFDERQTMLQNAQDNPVGMVEDAMQNGTLQDTIGFLQNDAGYSKEETDRMQDAIYQRDYEQRGDFMERLSNDLPQEDKYTAYLYEAQKEGKPLSQAQEEARARVNEELGINLRETYDFEKDIPTMDADGNMNEAAERIFRDGYLPSWTYGSELDGFNEASLDNIKTMSRNYNDNNLNEYSANLLDLFDIRNRDVLDNRVNADTDFQNTEGWQGVTINDDFADIVASSAGTARYQNKLGHPERVERVELTMEEYERMADAFLDANPVILKMINDGKLTYDMVFDHFFKDIALTDINGGNRSGNGYYNRNPYPYYPRGGTPSGGRPSGGGGGGYRGGGGGSYYNSSSYSGNGWDVDPERIYNTLKNWEF